MIYILVGNDIKKRSDYTKSITKGREVIKLPQSETSREKLIEYSGSQNLFGGSPVIQVDNVLGEGLVELSTKDLGLLQESDSMFIFIEDALKAVDEKKYKKYGEAERFEEKKREQPKPNTFAIVDSFAKRDKVGTWILYCEQIEKGVQPEAISGLIFWKIKSMIIGGSRSFTKDELKSQSSAIVSLYHRAHRGELDFTIGLEQFILSSLSK